MRNVWKKVCACVLCATMMVGVKVPSTSKQDMIAVSAADEYDGEFTDNGRKYQYKNNGSSEITLVRVLDQGGDLSVPSTVTINGKKKTVTRLEYPFCGWQTYSKVTIPNTVKTIGSYVFYSSTIDKLQLSSYIETIDVCFAMYAKVKSVSCSSKKIKQIDGEPFYGATCPKKIIFGDWLIRWDFDSSDTVLDLSTSDIQGIKHVQRNHLISFGDNVKTVKIGKSTFMLNIDYYSNWCFRNIENVILNGNTIKCTSANNTVPTVIKDNYSFFDYGKFNIKYASQKAECVLKSLGLTYYGPNNKKKGTLSANTEYNVCKKVHDYIVKNYTYVRKPTGSYLKVFNCNLVTQCEFDCQMFAFLVECAGVDAETCYQAGGDHAWNVVNIGGNLYYIDTTNDRHNHMYQLFLYSNETSEKGTDIWGGNQINTNQTYTNYGSDTWAMVTYPFADRKLNGKRPNCNKIHGDLDGDYYCRENDSTLLAAFNCVGETIKNKCLKSKDGYVSLTDSEFSTINASTSGNKTITLAKKENGKTKLLFNPQACDANFDGTVNILDVIVLNQRIGDPLR